VVEWAPMATEESKRAWNVSMGAACARRGRKRVRAKHRLECGLQWLNGLRTPDDPARRALRAAEAALKAGGSSTDERRQEAAT
jgi:hypothetical protein